jgi:cell shape-determining protein MreC
MLRVRSPAPCSRSKSHERIARPFRDAYGWTKDLFDARSENEKLRTQNEQLKQQVIQNESALQENVGLKSLLHYHNAPTFPQDYDGVAAEVISQPSRSFDQTIVSAGSDDGITVDAPVVTGGGLVFITGHGERGARAPARGRVRSRRST